MTRGVRSAHSAKNSADGPGVSRVHVTPVSLLVFVKTVLNPDICGLQSLHTRKYTRDSRVYRVCGFQRTHHTIMVVDRRGWKPSNTGISQNGPRVQSHVREDTFKYRLLPGCVMDPRQRVMNSRQYEFTPTSFDLPPRPAVAYPILPPRVLPQID